MKKTIALLLSVCLMVLPLAACGSKTASETGTAKAPAGETALQTADTAGAASETTEGSAAASESTQISTEKVVGSLSQTQGNPEDSSVFAGKVVFSGGSRSRTLLIVQSDSGEPRGFLLSGKGVTVVWSDGVTQEKIEAASDYTGFVVSVEYTDETQTVDADALKDYSGTYTGDWYTVTALTIEGRAAD